MNDDINEVLDLQQRRKRAMVMKRNKAKIERAREIAKNRLAPEDRLRKRAYIQARQIVRRRVAGERGANYAELGPSEKMQIDKQVESKKKLIKALAARLLPKVKRAESQRLRSFTHGHALQNHGKSEGNVKESLDEMFAETFGSEYGATNAMGGRTQSPLVSTAGKKLIRKGESKNPAIQQYGKFQEEMENETRVFHALAKKAEKSGVDIELVGEIFNRGWNTWTEETGVDQQQYAFARVNSFLSRGRAFNEDQDLQELSHKALDRYVTRASGEFSMAKVGERGTTRPNEKAYFAGQAKKRKAGIARAIDKQDAATGRTPEKPVRVPARMTESNNTPYVRPHYGDPNNPKSQTAWKASNKHGKVKYFGNDFKASANRHAGLQEARPVNNPAYDHSEKMWDDREKEFNARLDKKGRFTKSSARKMFGGKLSPDGESMKEDNDPCWKGYKQIGMKKKGGKDVPNCVPVKEGVSNSEQPRNSIVRKHVQKVVRHRAVSRKDIENVDRDDTEYNLPRHTEIMRKVIEDTNLEEKKLGNKVTDSGKRLIGTDSLVAAYKADTPGQGNVNEVFASVFGEEVKTADVKGEVVPAHTRIVTKPDGSITQVTVPGHVRRGRKNKTIIGSGNVTDGKAGPS